MSILIDQELVRMLQNFVLAFTQRLHKVEVERRDLKVRMNDIEMENDGLKKSVEKRQIEEARAHKDMEDIRQKVSCLKGLHFLFYESKH